MGTRASTANHTKQSNQKSKNPRKFKDVEERDEERGSKPKEPFHERNDPNVSASGTHQELRGKIKTMEDDLDEMSQELVKVSKGYNESKPSDDTDNMDSLVKIPYIDHDTEESEGSMTRENMPNDNDEVNIQITNETCSSPRKDQDISSEGVKEYPLASKMAKTNNNEVEKVHQGTSKSNEESTDKPKSNETKAGGSKSRERRKNKHFSSIVSDIDYYGQGINPNDMYGGQSLKITTRYRSTKSNPMQRSEQGT